MKTAQRRDAIEKLLARTGEAEFESLATRFGVSEMTIRRDAEQLELNGLARRVRGGVISTRGRAYEPGFDMRRDAAGPAKHAIAERVIALLSPGEVVILDSGSTALEVAREIHARELALTVITPSVLAALEVVQVPATHVIITGGTLRAGERSLIGAEAEKSFSGLNCDTFVAGVAGVDAVRGLSEYNRDEARVKQAAFESARRVIVVADESKLGRVHLVSLAPLSAIDILVTDADRSHPTVQACLDAGVQVITVDARTDDEDADADAGDD